MWGGGCCGDNNATGLAYDPALDKTQQLAAGPLAGRHASGVWTGTELIIIGGQADERVFADAAAYNPDTQSWRRLPPMPAPRAQATLTWTGTEVLVVGGIGPSATHPTVYADGLAYNPTTNRWRPLPSMGISRMRHVAVWTGTRLLIWGGQTMVTRNGETVDVAPPHGMSFDPVSGTWSALPTSPLRGRILALAAWTGTEMLIWGGESVSDPPLPLADGAAYRPAG
jgi:hypothetical protein